MDKRKGICGVCPGGCAVELTLDEGKIVDIAPQTGAKFGTMCIRGKHAPEIVYSPDRLQKPLIRCGPRGEGLFREANWDEALDFVADQILKIKDKYGPQALISHSGRGAFEQSMLDLNGVNGSVESKLLLPLGSPNTAGVTSLCYTSFGLLAPMTTLGLSGKSLLPDFENARLIVIWGTNTATDSPPFLHERLLKARQKGTRVIVIDPRRSDDAVQSDQWIPLRPGTDGALALGLLWVIIHEHLFDEEFVERWTTGFNELSAYLEDFSVDQAAKITGVPEPVIVSLAQEIALTRHSTVRLYTGVEYSNCGVQAIRAIYILWALTGNIDVPGGLLIDNPGRALRKPDSYHPPKGVLPIGALEYPLFYRLTGCAQFMEFPKAVLQGKPYWVRGLINNGASILTSYPQPEIWQEAFRHLDFMLVVDRFLTQDALYADVVLPATTYFENVSYQRYHGYLRMRERIIEPCGEARNDLLIFAEIAKRLGYGELYPHSDEEILRTAFDQAPDLLASLQDNPDGLTLSAPPRAFKKYETGELRADGAPGFATPSGKFEIASTLLADCGYNPLPAYIEPQEGPLASPELLNHYPLILNSGARIPSKFRSQHLNIPGLLNIQPNPEALLHPEDARSRGIENGEPVRVISPRGQSVFTAKVTDKMQPHVVEINMGGGNPRQAEAWRNSNANELTDYRNRDPISGFPVFKALLCQVEKRGGVQHGANRE